MNVTEKEIRYLKSRTRAQVRFPVPETVGGETRGPYVSLPAMTTELTPDRMGAVASGFGERYRPGRVRGLLIAGSGLELSVPGWTASDEIALDEILPFELQPLMGHRQTLTLWRRDDESLMVLNGRFHLYQGYAPEEVVAPVRLAGLLGAEVMIATNASGSLDPEIKPGSIVVVSDQGRHCPC